MRNEFLTILSFIVASSLAGTGVNTAQAQVSDVSDAIWSITLPAAIAVDVDMGQAIVNDSRDSVVARFFTNSGAVPIRLDSLTFTGSDADDFSLVSGIPPVTIAQGEYRALEFRFTPTSTGDKNAAIELHTQVGSLIQSIRGTGISPVADLYTDLVDFGVVMVDAVKDTTIDAAIRNTGSETLTISGATLLGPEKTQFEILSGGGSVTLAPGESLNLELRFTPSMPGRTSGRIGLYHGGVGSPAIIHLFGEAKGTQGTATLAMDTVKARAGELVELPVYLRNPNNLELTGARGFYAELRFNASLLSPTGSTPQGIVIGDERTIFLDYLPLQADGDSILARLEFVAMLGTAAGSAVYLENAVGLDGDVSVSELPGYFLLSDVCREGGARLYLEGGSLSLRQNHPNPFNISTVIEYELVEDGPTRLFIMDMLGRTVAVLAAEIMKPGRYSATFDASSLPSGMYLYILQAPSQRIAKVMEVVK